MHGRPGARVRGERILSGKPFHSAEGITIINADTFSTRAVKDESVDLIVTSPPYASNAIDYMRAHKFSLVWLGHGLDSLAHLRREYIGHDAALGFQPETLPDYAAQTVASLARIDPHKSVVLHRYYSEMSRTLREMARVLKPGKAAIVVVGTSTMRGMDTRTDVCLGEIGKQAGLELVHIASRRLDRDKRMMPARKEHGELASQIEARMHEEYVIGFIKPGTSMPLTETRRMFAAEGRPFVVCLPSLDKVVLL